MDHAINTVILEQVVGSATVDLLLVAGSAGLFSADIITKAAHQGIHSGVNFSHQIRERQVKSCDITKERQQISNSVFTTKNTLCLPTRNIQATLELV